MICSEISESILQLDDDDKDCLQKERKNFIKNLKNHLCLSKKLFTYFVTTALDRNRTSDREAQRLIISIVSALAQDPGTLPFSRNTIQRSRKKARK